MRFNQSKMTFKMFKNGCVEFTNLNYKRVMDKVFDSKQPLLTHYEDGILYAHNEHYSYAMDTQYKVIAYSRHGQELQMSKMPIKMINLVEYQDKFYQIIGGKLFAFKRLMVEFIHNVMDNSSLLLKENDLCVISGKWIYYYHNKNFNKLEEIHMNCQLAFNAGKNIIIIYDRGIHQIAAIFSSSLIWLQELVLPHYFRIQSNNFGMTETQLVDFNSLKILSIEKLEFFFSKRNGYFQASQLGGSSPVDFERVDLNINELLNATHHIHLKLLE